MIYYVYIIKLANNSYYTGYTIDIKKRVMEHKSNKCTTTKRLVFEKLVWFGAFNSKKLALEFERYLKSSSGFAFRNKHFI